MTMAAAGFSYSAIMGLFLALVPSLTVQIFDLSDPLWSSEIVALLFAASAVVELFLRRLPTRVAVISGLAAMVGGLAALAFAALIASTPLFLLGTVLDGAGQGLALMGVLAAINLASPPVRRNEIISSLYIFNYLGLALPVLGMGIATHFVGLIAATLGFAGIIGTIALFALIELHRVDATRHPDMASHAALAGAPRTA
jgi:MFS family permease